MSDFDQVNYHVVVLCREAVIETVGREIGLKVFGGLNNAWITKEEVKGAVKEMPVLFCSTAWRLTFCNSLS